MLSLLRVILFCSITCSELLTYFHKSSKNSKEFSESLVQLLVHMIVVQFSMSFRLRFRFARHPFGQPIHYITSASLCQGVFEIFFEVFFLPSIPFSRLSPKALSLYHFFPALSRAFLNLFVVFGLSDVLTHGYIHPDTSGSASCPGMFLPVWTDPAAVPTGDTPPSSQTPPSGPEFRVPG